MTARSLSKSEWQTYFDQISKHLVGERAMVEIRGIEFIGDRRQARSLPLIGITYDSKDNILQIAMEGLDHLIHEPHSIKVFDGPWGLDSLEVIDSSRQKQLVTLVRPLRQARRGSNDGDKTRRAVKD